MGLSFPKQVVRPPRVRHVVTEKFCSADGLVVGSATDRRTFYSRSEAERYASERPGMRVGHLLCYVALVSTEYTE